MKFFTWMRNKPNERKGKKKPDSISSTHHTVDEACRDEFSDWPQALLAIGTFGNSKLKEEDYGRIRIDTIAEDSSSSQHCLQQLIPEEEEEEEEEKRQEGGSQNELKICLREQVESSLTIEQEESPAGQINGRSSNSERREKETFLPNSSLIPSKGKDLCLENNKTGIGKKSLSFLLKKVFVCRSGFQPTPSIKDPLSTESRMEKILRAILNKKIHPQGSSSTMVIKKYLENKHMAKSDNDEYELNTAAVGGSKWVKTDSEYIVLEI